MNYFHNNGQVCYYNGLQIIQGYADGLTPLTEEELQLHLNPPISIEDIADQIRAERDRLIADIRWRIERHQDETILGLEPTEPIEPILEYIQALRDIPQQEGFPEDITWPEVP